VYVRENEVGERVLRNALLYVSRVLERVRVEREREWRW